MQKTKRILALLLVAALTVMQLPMTALATNAGDGGEIIAFDALPEETANQAVAFGTSLVNLDLPGTLNATVRMAAKAETEEPKPDNGTVQAQQPGEPSQPVAEFGSGGEGQSQPDERQSGPEADGEQPEPEPDKPEMMEINIPVPVEWASSPDYDCGKAGTYTFTAQISGFTISASLPSIIVAVGERIATVTAFDILPNSTDPNFSGGGTVDSPFLIGTAEELVNLASLVNAGNDVYQNAYYRLTANLDLSIYDASNTGFNSGNGWVPIGSNTDAFKGNFDGNSKTITGLYINDSGRDYAGLFGFVSGTMGVIHNLTVEGVSINAGGSTGGIVGRAEDDANINHCSASGTVKGSGNIGGVAGFIDQATMDQCAAAVAVSGSTCIGGVVGSLGTSASVTNCCSTETVSGSDDYVGGVVGNLGTSSSVTNCYFTGTVSVSGSNVSCIGGVVGNVGNSASVTNCYTTGTIKGDPYGGYAKYVGGVAGGVSGSITSCCFTGLVDADDKVGGVAGGVFSGAIVSNCYAMGTVRTTESAGGIAGSVSSRGIVTSCYSTALVQGYQYIGGIAGYVYEGSVTNCMALGPEVRSTKEGYGGRVVTGYYYVLSDNLAFSGMLNKAGNTSWPNAGGNYRDGKSITAEELQTSASFPLVFMQAPWTYEPGSLPGLGNTVEMPAHITTQLPNLQDALVELQAASYTYDGTAQEPAVQVTFKGDKLVENEDYSVSYSDNINAGNAKVTVTGIGVCRGTKTEIFAIEPKPLTADMLTDVIGTFTYTGTARMPAITVTDGAKALIEGTDYTTTYANNINAGTAVVNVTGRGNYTGTVSKNFTIGKAPLIIAGASVMKTYDGTTAAIVDAVEFDGLKGHETLTSGIDYTVTDAQFDSADAGDSKILAGAVSLLSTILTDNYTLTSAGFNLTNQTIAKATTAGVNQTLEVANGRVQDCIFDLPTLLPDVAGTLGAITYAPAITENSDGVLGSLAYTSGNTLTIPVQPVADAGKTAVITVTVSSTNYKDFTAAITVKTIDAIPLTVTGLTVGNKTYDGSTAATLSGTAVLVATNVQAGDEVTLTGTPSAVFDNANAGTNKAVTITGLSLTGRDAAKYTLNLSGFAGTITAKTLTNAVLAPAGGPFTYTGMPHTPDVAVTDDGKTLEKGTDYSITYSSNTNAGTAIINVVGRGNYTGMASSKFTIAKAPLTITGGTVARKVYDGSITAAISAIAFGGLQNGETLAIVADYTVTDAAFDSADAGGGKTVTGTVTLLETPTTVNYALSSGSLSISGQAIAKAAEPSITWPAAAGVAYGSPLSASALLGGSTQYGSFAWSTPETIPTVTNSGYEVSFTPSPATQNNYEPVSHTTQKVEIVVTPKGFSRLAVDPIAATTYTGMAYAPDVTVKDGSTTLVNGTDYTADYLNNTNAGTATVVIQGIGNYWEIVKVFFTIKRATPAALTWPNAAAITYGLPLAASDLTGGSNTGRWAWADGTVVPSAVNSGYEVTFTPNDMANYDWSGVTLRQKVPLTVHKATGLSVSAQPFMNARESAARSYEFDIDNIALNKADTGAKTYSAAEGTDASNILSDVQVNGSKLTYAISGSAAAGNTATVAITISTANYEDVTAILTINVTEKETQTIGFEDSIITKTYGDGKFTQTAALQGDGGTGEITYASDNIAVATVNAATGEVAIVGAGSANITAIKAADDDWYAATAVYGLTVSKKTVTITAHDKTAKVGQSQPVYTHAVSGLISDEGLMLEPAVTCPTANMSAPGTYAIVPSGAAAGPNYAIQYQNGTLTVSALSTACGVVDVTSPAGSSISGTNIMATVANSVSSQLIVVTVSADAAWALFRDASCTSEITSKTMALSVGANKAYIKVTAEDGITARIYTVTVTRTGGGGSGGGSGGCGSSSGGDTATAGPKKQPDQPVIAAATVNAAAGTGGRADASIPVNVITDAIAKAQAEARKQGKTANGIGVSLDVKMPGGASSLSLTLSQAALQSLTGAKARRLEIGGGIASLYLDLEALREIQKQSTGGVTIIIKPVQSLFAAAKKLIGTRPVYDVAIRYIKDGITMNIASLGKGGATLSFPYIPGNNEAAGYLFGVYVDGKGNATRIPASAYDANSGSVILPVDNFSVCGVGYMAPAEKYADIVNHWAKESIDYVLGLGLFSGAVDTDFSPDVAMDRGMLVTVLGRLAGADVNAYKTSSFSDVATGKYYLPYVEWAYKEGVVGGAGGGKFAPERAVTREEIALILQSYAKATGYTLPITREALTYADAFRIGNAYKTAVTAMQQAGIIISGSGNKFNPKAGATRAEVAAMLHRYIKLTVDPATAQGWAKNDDGQYLYYKDGKPLNGWQIIGGARYFFNANGTLQTGWVKDGVNWRFYSGNKALVGWWDIDSETSKKRYYFDANAVMISGKWLEIDGEWYYFYADGSLAVSKKIDGSEVDGNGVRITK